MLDGWNQLLLHGCGGNKALLPVFGQALLQYIIQLLHFSSFACQVKRRSYNRRDQFRGGAAHKRPRTGERLHHRDAERDDVSVPMPKRSCHGPISTLRRPQSSTAFPAPTRRGAIVTQPTNSLTGIVPSRDYRSARLWFDTCRKNSPVALATTGDHQNLNFLLRLCEPGNHCVKFIEYLVPAL